jgi:hypothetical protein
MADAEPFGQFGPQSHIDLPAHSSGCDSPT